MNTINTIIFLSLDLWNKLTSLDFFAGFMPLILAYEAPLMLLVIIGILSWYRQTFLLQKNESLYQPNVSCIITCYSEGDAVAITINSLIEQNYKGNVEIIAVIDGAVDNQKTYQAALKAAKKCSKKNRKIILLPKWQRGGRVSSLNAGLSIATGEIVMNADADTSFDNNMLTQIIPYFEDENVPAVGGALRVRNTHSSILTVMQSIEYLLSMQGGKTGLAHWNLINNVSGAFGAFRREVLVNVGGWNTHTAEDLDLTIRLKQYFKRHPNWKIPFATLAIGHTDVPADLTTLVKQRLRWDGDLFFLYLRKHWKAFTPKLMGTKSFIFTFLYGVVQNIALPFIIVIYLTTLTITQPWQLIIAIAVVVYSIYLTFLVTFYLVVLLAISEKPKQDLRLMPWLLIYPVYALFMRLLAAFAVMNEMLRRSHEESAMAPWWVLKRGRKF